ncbi:MAG: hypothetical protein K6F05_01510 [Succinivibrio sp.]|nr:hypothetical protein [Succinivibrio sp.]
MEYRLKQSVIDKFKPDPRQLEIEAKNIKDNYETSDKSFDVLALASLCMVVYAGRQLIRQTHHVHRT